MLVPNAELREFNKCHNPDGPGGGRFCSTVGNAQRDLLAGQKVILHDVKDVYTLIDRLAKMALEAEKLGKEAPNYDLSLVTVPNTNIFMGLYNGEHPKGLSRTEMPQLGGAAVPGSPAMAFANAQGRVDGSKQFIEYVRKSGVKVENEMVHAASLKATQKELVGAKVAKIMSYPERHPESSIIFVSRDNYIIDGHHRWAAIVGRDAKDGKLGNSRIRVTRIDLPIMEALKLTNKFSKDFGIAAKGLKEVFFLQPN